MARIAIVGGGLAGLCAAHVLTRARHSVLVLEAEPRLGGQIHTARSNGLVAELGAEGYVAREAESPAVVSGLAGAIWRVGEHLDLDGAVRVARQCGEGVLEVRAGLTWTVGL